MFLAFLTLASVIYVAIGLILYEIDSATSNAGLPRLWWSLAWPLLVALAVTLWLTALFMDIRNTLRGGRR